MIVGVPREIKVHEGKISYAAVAQAHGYPSVEL